MSTQLEYLRQLNAKGRLRKSNKLYIGKTVRLGDTESMRVRKFYLPNRDRGSHFGIIGTTRIGKTRLTENLISQDIRAGRNVIIIDPKGDQELLSKILQVAVESGRLDDLILLTAIFPSLSTKIDPLAYYYIEDELVDHVVSGIETDQKDRFFIGIASEISSVIISGLLLDAKAKGIRVPLNFNDIKTRSTYPALKSFAESLDNLRRSSDREISESVEEILKNIEHILNSPPEFFSKVSTTLRTTLTALTSSTTGRIVGKAYTNEFVKRFEQGRRVIFICNTGSLLTRRTAYILARVILSMIQSTVGRFFASGRKIDPPLCLYIDEGHNVLYKGIQELFNKSGGAGVWITFLTQSIAQMEEEIGEQATQSIMDNISTWLFMKVNNDKTAQIIEDMSPLHIKREPYVHFDGGDIRISLRETQERLILKERASRLKPRWFYLKHQGGIYKGYVPEVEPARFKVIYPKIEVL